jgi:hypothetical protein
MSADNAIVIVKSVGGTCKVRHMQAVDNLYWDEVTNDYGQFINTKALYQAFKNVPVLANMDVAEMYATDLLQEYDYVEYGIIIIEAPSSWNMIDKYYGKLDDNPKVF